MATINPVWTENIELVASGSLAASGSNTADIDLDTLGYDLVLVAISITFVSGSDKDIVIDVLPSANSGTTDATEPIASYVIPFATSGTKIKTIVISDVPYAAIKVSNPDTADAVTYASIYAGRKWTSA